MATATEEVKSEAGVVRYSVSDSAIAELRSQFTGLTAETREGYEQVRKAIGTCRDLRVDIEKRRVELKADALAWGRKVDAEAKRLTGLLESIEEPLKIAKQAVDDAKERERRAKEEAERARVEAELKAKRDAEEAIAAAERARIAEEQWLEAERLAKIEAEQAEARAKLEAERKAIEAERLAVEEAKRKAEQEEFERQAKIRAEQEARERVERERAEAEARRLENERRELEERKRIEELRPDVEKVNAFAATLRGIALPSCKNKAAKAFVDDIAARITSLAVECESFSEKRAK